MGSDAEMLHAITSRAAGLIALAVLRVAVPVLVSLTPHPFGDLRGGTSSWPSGHIVAIQKRDAAPWKPLIRRLRAGESTHAGFSSRRSKAKAPRFGS